MALPHGVVGWSAKVILMAPWVGLQYAIVVFPDHAHLLFISSFCWRYLFLSCYNYDKYGLVTQSKGGGLGFMSLQGV